MVPLRIGKNLNQRVGEEKGVKRQGGWGVFLMDPIWEWKRGKREPSGILPVSSVQ